MVILAVSLLMIKGIRQKSTAVCSILNKAAVALCEILRSCPPTRWKLPP